MQKDVLMSDDLMATLSGTGVMSTMSMRMDALLVMHTLAPVSAMEVAGCVGEDVIPTTVMGWVRWEPVW